MKNVKSDTKYIIKRILIGVGIAIILFNLKKCNVYAYSSVRTYQLNNNNSNATWIQSTTDISSCNYNATLYSFEYEDIKYNLCIKNSSVSYSGTGINVFLYSNDLYVAYGSYNINYINNNNLTLDNIYYDLTYSSDNTSGRIESFIKTTDNRTLGYYRDSSSGLIPNTQQYGNYDTKMINISNFGTNNNITATDLITNDNYKNMNIVYNSLNIPVYFNTTEIEEPIQNPLANYTQLDLTGYQAVLLVPKNYQIMLSDSSHTNENPPGIFRTYLDLEYYSQECVRGTLINIENVQDIMLNNIGVGTGNIVESISGTCYQEPTQTIMSYEFDQYSGLKARGLLVYNGSQDWQSGFGTETPFFGTSYVWYNPDLYNAYLVESFDNFNQTISYKDYSGEDQEVTIESLPTFTESMENAIDNVDSPTPTEVNRQKLQAIFNFLKTPFTFLNKLNTTSCSAIVFPLPFVNRNLTLECMSTAVYNKYLPNILKTFIITILNGLIFYRCTLNNIDIFTNILDPEDNKLEAIDL